jgi:hypothetical protein
MDQKLKEVVGALRAAQTKRLDFVRSWKGGPNPEFRRLMSELDLAVLSAERDMQNFQEQVRQFEDSVQANAIDDDDVGRSPLTRTESVDLEHQGRRFDGFVSSFTWTGPSLSNLCDNVTDPAYRDIPLKSHEDAVDEYFLRRTASEAAALLDRQRYPEFFENADYEAVLAALKMMLTYSFLVAPIVLVGGISTYIFRFYWRRNTFALIIIRSKSEDIGIERLPVSGTLGYHFAFAWSRLPSGRAVTVTIRQREDIDGEEWKSIDN